MEYEIWSEGYLATGVTHRESRPLTWMERNMPITVHAWRRLQKNRIELRYHRAVEKAAALLQKLQAAEKKLDS
jgi:hypothetical protein